MLNEVIGLYETIKSIACLSIFLSYRIGQIIVNTLLTSLEILQKFINTIWTVLVILNEDLFVFVYDVGSRLSFVIGSIISFMEYLGESVASFIYLLKYNIFGVAEWFITAIQTIIDIISKVFSSFGNLIGAIKHFIVLLGSGVWFTITLVPVFIVYVCIMTTYYIGRAFEESKSMVVSTLTKTETNLLDVMNFILDVPLESFAGLVVISCLIYAMVKFHIALYSALSRFTALMLSGISRNVARLNLNITSMRRRVIAVESETSSDSEMSDPAADETRLSKTVGWQTKTQRRKQMMEEDNRLCVICMERNKCMLSMPCRHMCTCSECNDTLRHYQRNCPICRRYVNYTIHVY